ncbi:hypothetical protein H0H87_008388 [Tephrocybe sp. NHM501043]|nr:hypothetical protein H0H87_008388 [Tephrocybe sp. NHM501043]
MTVFNRGITYNFRQLHPQPQRPQNERTAGPQIPGDGQNLANLTRREKNTRDRIGGRRIHRTTSHSTQDPIGTCQKLHIRETEERNANRPSTPEAMESKQETEIDAPTEEVATTMALMVQLPLKYYKFQPAIFTSYT